MSWRVIENSLGFGTLIIFVENGDFGKFYTQIETKATQMLMQFVKPCAVLFNHFYPSFPLPNEGVGPKSHLGLLCNYLGNIFNFKFPKSIIFCLGITHSDGSAELTMSSWHIPIKGAINALIR